MNGKSRKILLGIYDLILSIGAIYLGILMILSNSGIFAEYPKEWLDKVPFQSWVTPGIIGILVFGLGNIISAAYCFIKDNSKAWILSTLLGCIFFTSLVAQVILLGEWYMATTQFFIFSIIQLSLSAYVFNSSRKNPKSY